MSVMTHFLLWYIGLASPRTFYSPAACACLERHAKGKRRLVEIGCWHGVNTLRLRRAMAPEGVLFAVDPYPAGRLGFSTAKVIARREVGKSRNGEVRWVQMTDQRAARYFEESGEPPVDVIFSDASNDYRGFEVTWEAWSPLIRRGGIYILANSHATPLRRIASAGSVRFTRDVVEHDRRFETVETVETFTVLRRREVS